MNILVLAPHTFYTDRGTPIDVDILLRALSECGHHAEVCVYSDGEDRSYDNVTLFRIEPPRWLRGIGPGFSLKKVLADLYLLKLAWKRCRLFKPDVIHAGEEAVFIAWLLKLRYKIAYVYDMDSSIAQQMIEKKKWLKPFARLFNWVEGMAVRRAIACAPVCHALADLAQQHRASHVETLHDISQLSNPERNATGFLHEKLGMPHGRLVLMYVGNFEEYQGVGLLVEAFSIASRTVENVDLVVAGGSDEAVRVMQAKIDAYGICDRTHLIGRWPADRLDELLAEADILTAPRIRGINTPQKIFPYMHSGTAVLLTRLPTHTQIVDDSVCELADPSPQAFAQAIVRLAEDGERRDSLGRSGREFVEKEHVYPAHLERVRRLYREVASGLGR